MKSLHRLPDGTYERRFARHIFGSAPPPPPNIQMPTPSAPPQLPQSRPQRRGMQQSFLSGAAMAQQAGAAGSTSTRNGGHTLLGQ